MALVTQHKKGTVPGDSCPCPKVGAPRKNEHDHLQVSHPSNKVIGGTLGSGKDFSPGAKGALKTSRGGSAGRL